MLLLKDNFIIARVWEGVKFFRCIWEKQSVIYWNNKQYMAVFFV